MVRESTTRRKVLGTLGIGGVAGLAGCTSDEPTDTDSGQTETTAATTDDGNDGGGGDDATETTTEETTAESQLEDSATVALPSDPTAGVWDVYGGVMPYYTNVLEPLIWVTDEMTLEPWLATDWTATGEKTWEFSLREGVTFHNGQPLNADAVVWSFEQILGEWSWAPGWLHVKPDGITAVDDMTVEFTTTDPFPAFPGTIAHNMVAIQHPDRNRDEKQVVGTGPFQVTAREKGQRVETETYPEYWNGESTLSELVFRVIEDPNTRALSLQNEEVDVAYGPPKNKVQSLNDAEATNVETQLSPSAGYLGINVHKSPTDDVVLRRALNYAVSQQTLVDSILNGIGKPANSPIAESIYWSAHEKVPTYPRDADEASSLVEESGYDGETLGLYLSTEMVDGKLLAQALQQWFSKAGVTVEIHVMEDAAFDDAVRNGEAHLVLTESGTNSGAADYLIYETYHSEGDVNERQYNENGTGLYNLGSEIDDLISTGFQTADPDTKEDVYEQVLVEVMDQAVVVPLYYSEYIVGTYRDVESLDLRPIPEMSRWTGLKHLK